MKRVVYFAEMVIAPILVAVLLVTSSLPIGDRVGLFAGGALAWSLAEYAVHRMVLHDLAPTQHRQHHAHPRDRIGTIFWPIWLCFAVVYLLAGGVVLAGALAAYAWYLFVHHCAHHRRDALPSSLVRHHNGHHRYATRNFGVSTTLWDHVFGTVLR
jgi:sterol desaturase/sphingolipid hydroxylase (fatty acid hydroxylase superfamily)